MKLLTMLLFLTGCTTTRDYHMLSKQVAEYGIQRYEDKQKNVVCYVYRDDDSPAISCLKDVKKKEAQ